MKAKGIIRLRVNHEAVNFTTDCSKDAFIELTKILNQVPTNYAFVSSMYFDEGLKNKEFKILTK
jgi:hypothetical protein